MNPLIKTYVIPVIILFACIVEGIPIPDLGTFRKASNPGASYDENFNSGADFWRLSQGFELRQGEGCIGSPALFSSVEAGKTPKETRATLPIKITAGAIYNISIQYRTDDIQLADKEARARHAFILGYIQTYDKDGSRLKAQNIWVDTNFTSDWQSCRYSVTIPSEAVPDAELIMVFDWWHTGKIWFDDISIVPSDITATILPLEPSNLTLFPGSSLAFRVFFHDPEQALWADLAILAEMPGKRVLLHPENQVFRSRPEDTLIPGKIKTTLLNLRKKTILAEHSHRLFAAPVQESPAGVTMIDPYGRVICDGTPVLPIGTFTYQRMKEEDLVRVKEAGFDFVSFGCRAANLAGESSNSTATMQKMLDGLARHQLKAMLQLTLMIPAKETLRKKFEADFDGYRERDQLLPALITAVRRHPAFLGYYLSDENQRNELQQVQGLRELVSFHDPWHLTVTLTDRPDNFPFFVPTGDVLCHDSYPLPKANEVLKTDKNLAMLQQLRTPAWFCAQGFLWRIIRPEPSNEPDPTPGAIRAIPLLSVIYGVKGFLFYSYHEVFTKGPRRDPSHADVFWPQVVSAVQMLRELEPFILSTLPAPETINVQARQGLIRSRIFHTENGRHAVALAALTPGQNSASLNLPEGIEFTSRYGLSTKQTDGSWLFVSNGIDCDILFSK